MAEIQLKAKILPRSDTEANWSSVNPSILPQELIYITDKNDFKINGTGAATNFSSLQYLFESKLLGLLTEAEANTKYLQLTGGTITGNLDVDGSLTVGTLSGLLKATSGVVAAAVAGTDYPDPSIYQTGGIVSESFYIKNNNTTVGINYSGTTVTINGERLIPYRTDMTLGAVGSDWSTAYIKNLNVSATTTLSHLGTGLVKSTNGELSIAVAGTDYPNPSIYKSESIDFPISDDEEGKSSLRIDKDGISTYRYKYSEPSDLYGTIRLFKYIPGSNLTQSGTIQIGHDPSESLEGGLGVYQNPYYNNIKVFFNGSFSVESPSVAGGAKLVWTNTGALTGSIQNPSMKATLGTSGTPWDNLYSEYLSYKGASGPEVFIKSGVQVGPTDYGYALGYFDSTPTEKSTLQIMVNSDFPWIGQSISGGRIRFSNNSVTLDVAGNYQVKLTNTSFSSVGLFKPTLGSEDHPWETTYTKKISSGSVGASSSSSDVFSSFVISSDAKTTPPAYQSFSSIAFETMTKNDSTSIPLTLRIDNAGSGIRVYPTAGAANGDPEPSTGKLTDNSFGWGKDHSWRRFYMGDMQLYWNSDEEAIEFLAE